MSNDNPNLQCNRCGKWRRLITRGEQIMFPYYIEDTDSSMIELYDCLCEVCRAELDKYKKELLRAYNVGLEMAA